MPRKPIPILTALVARWPRACTAALVILLAGAATVWLLGGQAAKGLGATGAAAATPPAAVKPTSQGEVNGFRSARWGMTEAEVKTAITKDFRIAPNKVPVQQDLAERTTALAITVPGLIDGAGPARILYILGYKTNRLIQVNIEWGGQVDPRANAAGIVAAANELRAYFLGAGYDPKTITANLRLADGTIIVFRGEDAQKHMTLLRLVSLPAASRRKGAAAAPQRIALFLSYTLDAQRPDIFRLKKGQF